MMRRWLVPVVVALIVACATYAAVLVAAPHVLMMGAFQRLRGGGINRFYAVPLADDTARMVVRPSPDLAYSTCPFDLSKGPVLLDVKPVPAPYWSLSVFDMTTNTVFVRNNLHSHSKSVRIALVAEGQTAPEGIEAVPMPGTRGIALIRILVDNRAHFPEIDRVRRTAVCGVVGH